MRESERREGRGEKEMVQHRGKAALERSCAAQPRLRCLPSPFPQGTKEAVCQSHQTAKFPQVLHQGHLHKVVPTPTEKLAGATRQHLSSMCVLGCSGEHKTTFNCNAGESERGRCSASFNLGF